MKILAISHIVSGFTQEDLNPYGLEEIKAAWELYAENTFREIYYSKDRHAAIIVFKCEIEEEPKNYWDSANGGKRFNCFRLLPVRTVRIFLDTFC